MAEAENKNPVAKPKAPSAAPAKKEEPGFIGPPVVLRVVTGNKPFSAVDEEGNRYLAQPGETVKVRGVTARNFAHVLVDPAVAEAQKKADEARAAAEAAAVKAEGAVGGDSKES